MTDITLYQCLWPMRTILRASPQSFLAPSGGVPVFLSHTAPIKTSAPHSSLPPPNYPTYLSLRNLDIHKPRLPQHLPDEPAINININPTLLHTFRELLYISHHDRIRRRRGTITEELTERMA